MDLESIIRKMVDELTPEKLRELGQIGYNEDREYPECFSNWYPHIEDFGKFKHANVIANPIFTFEETEAMKATEDIKKVDWNKIDEILRPTLEKLDNFHMYNIKNGCFSNKFDFDTCLTSKRELAEKLWKINYQSAVLETGGYTELVVREVIPNCLEYPTIYNGMPLREEIRIFYNMDTKQIEYMVDYWDYEYCREHLNKTDQIVFDWFYNKIGNRKVNHQNKLKELFLKIEKDINTLKFDSQLKGIWSIDFLWEEIEDEIYLIDMARGYRSSYWDSSKCKKKEVME